VRRLRTDLVKDADAVAFRCRLDQTRQHELEEHVVVDDVEAEASIGRVDGIDEQTAAFGTQYRGLTNRCGVDSIEVQNALAGVEELPCLFHLHGQFCFSSGRTDVLDDLVLSA
jgi:hypothetical protein